MKRLKLATGALGLFIITVLFLNCNSSKNTNSAYSFSQNPPFTMVEAYSQKWMAGVKEGGSGTNIYLKIENIEIGTSINEIYFSNKSAKANPSTDNLYIGYYKNEENRDVIMDSDPNKEAKNTPPKTFPFKLEENEAVISYLFKGMDYYFKVSNITEKEILAYPMGNPNNGN